MEWKCILAVLFLVQYLDLSLGTATLKIDMISFKNEKEHDWYGKCCDPWCVGACDHLFTFCIDTATSGDQDYSSCHYFIKKTGEFKNQNENIFDDNMQGVANPIVRSFTTWPSGGIKFKIRVDDDDTGHSRHDSVDRLRYQLNDTPKRAENYAIWQLKVITGFRSSHKTSASFKYKLYCDEYYFGSYCAIYCKAQNTDAAGHYTCHPTTGAKQCRPGWEGDDCKIFSDDCAGDPCKNGATCTDGNRRYTCTCKPGFTGTTCEEKINECDSGPCLHGDCLDRENHYICRCKPGYVGQTCNLDLCQAAGYKHCLNNGSCYIDNVLAKCYCTPGYTGEQCETNKCEEIVCQNGGTCLDGECQCTAGYSGAFCGVDWCERHPCHNGGTCSEGECTCTGGAHGRYCEFACSDETCDNDGTCVDYGSGDGYHCLCLPQFNGTHCEFTMPETTEVEILPEEDQEHHDDKTTTTTTTTTTPIPGVGIVGGQVNGNGNSTAQNGAPLWIIGLVCALLFVIVIVILFAFLLVKRYRRKARSAEDNAFNATTIDDSNGMAGIANPVYVTGDLPTSPEGGAVGGAPVVYYHRSDPPPYKEKMEDDDDPAYSQIGGSTTKTEIHVITTNSKVDPMNLYDTPRALEPTYDCPRPSKSSDPEAGLGAEGAEAPPLPQKQKTAGVEAPPLPAKQKDMGEQAPPLPDKHQL